MPQNFRTWTLPLTQEQYERVQSSEALPCPPIPPVDAVTARRQQRRFCVGEPWREGYRVVTCTLADGRVIAGVLCFGDELLVPAWIASFGCADIISLAPTPAALHPDFTITEPDALHPRRDRGGDSLADRGTEIRIACFGPAVLDPDSRSMPPEEAWELALETERDVTACHLDLPSFIDGLHAVRLMQGGYFELTIHEASSDEVRTHRIRPREAAIWREILRTDVALEDGVTLADLARALDLPEALDREVSARCSKRSCDVTLAMWRRRILAPYVPRVSDQTATLVVRPYSTDETGPLEFGWILVTRTARRAAVESVQVDAKTLPSMADSIECGVLGEPPAALRSLPIVIDPNFVIGPSVEAWRSWQRRQRGRTTGEANGLPDAPQVRYQGILRCTFGDVIGAVLDELHPTNAGFVPVGSARSDAMAVGDGDAHRAALARLHQAFAAIVEPLEDALIVEGTSKVAELHALAGAIACHIEAVFGARLATYPSAACDDRMPATRDPSDAPAHRLSPDALELTRGRLVEIGASTDALDRLLSTVATLDGQAGVEVGATGD